LFEKDSKTAAADITFDVFKNVYTALRAVSKTEKIFKNRVAELNFPYFVSLWDRATRNAKQELGGTDAKKYTDDLLDYAPSGGLVRAFRGTRTSDSDVLKMFALLRRDTPNASFIIDIGFAEGVPPAGIIEQLISFTSLPITSEDLTLYQDVFLNKMGGRDLVYALVYIYDAKFGMDEDLLELYSPKPGIYKRWLVGAPLNLAPGSTVTRIFEEGVMNYDLATRELGRAADGLDRGKYIREVKLWFDILCKSALIVDRLKANEVKSIDGGKMPISMRLRTLPGMEDDPAKQLTSDDIAPGELFSASPFVGTSPMNAKELDDEKPIDSE